LIFGRLFAETQTIRSRPARSAPEGERFIADLVRRRRPPFDPQAVVQEYAALAAEYGCREVTGDNYGAAWVETAFRAAGLSYRRSPQPKSQLYLEGLHPFTRGGVSLPDHPALLRELRLLERRAGRVGRDVIDRGRTGGDDHANALFGALSLAATPRRRVRVGYVNRHGGITWDPPARWTIRAEPPGPYYGPPS